MHWQVDRADMGIPGENNDRHPQLVTITYVPDFYIDTIKPMSRYFY